MTEELETKEALPDFQTQILNNGVGVSLSETDDKISLELIAVNLIKDIDGVINLRDMLDSVINNYFDTTTSNVKDGECDTCEDCTCDECVGPCYAQ